MDNTKINQAAGSALPMPPAGDQAALSAAASNQPTGNAAPSATAQDEDDVIDRAWIDKAKQIIMATSGDPYKQSQQLAALKTEYLEKRYHKTVQASS